MLSLADLQLDPIHYAIAEAFTDHKSSIQLIAHMVKLSELGHLCLPLEILNSEDLSTAMTWLKNCSPHLISYKKELKSTPIYFENNCIYLHKSYKAETRFFFELNRYLATFKPRVVPHFEYDHTCNEKQNLAIQQALEAGMLILTGGPGTGKTYTAKKIALNLLTKSLFFKKSLILAAPTSKALDQLKKSIGTLPGDVEIIADTLHKLVEFKSKKPAYLNASCIIVDEASMIEAPLMAKLFSCLGNEAKVILMGDPYQLPPVGMGALFQDLLELKMHFPFIKHVHLDHVQRCNDTSLKKLADIVNNQGFEELEQYLKQPHENLKMIHHPLDSFQKDNFEIMSSIFLSEPFYHDDLKNLENIHFNSIILSTLKKGPLGVDHINQRLHEHFVNKGLSYRFFIEPIMLLENDRDQNLFNGQQGLKIMDRHENKTLFYIKNTLIACLDIQYTPCFALSVHKSQGSEYNHVLFMVPEGSEKFSREIIYTACTRVKKTLYFWFSSEPLKAAMIKKTSRLSGLQYRIKVSKEPSPI